MSKKEGNWFKRHKFLTVLLGVVVLIIVISIANSGNDDSGTTGTSNSASSEKTYRFNDRADKQKTDVEFAVGEWGTVDGVKLTVNSAEYKTSLGEYETAADGKTYAVVHVTIENTSDSTKAYNPYDFRIQTAGGQVLDPGIAISVDTLNSGDLVTGGTVSGNIVFEVPTEEGHQYLIWKPNAIKSDRAIVELK